MKTEMFIAFPLSASVEAFHGQRLKFLWVKKKPYFIKLKKIVGFYSVTWKNCFEADTVAEIEGWSL